MFSEKKPGVRSAAPGRLVARRALIIQWAREQVRRLGDFAAQARFLPFRALPHAHDKSCEWVVPPYDFSLEWIEKENQPCMCSWTSTPGGAGPSLRDTDLESRLQVVRAAMARRAEIASALNHLYDTGVLQRTRSIPDGN